MDELKQAYETMGLPELAAKEEVEKRYTTLMRQARSRSKQNPEAAEDEDAFAKVTQAYRLILAYEDRKETDAFNEQEYGKYKKMAGQAQKVDHFWRYYKFHTIGAIAAVVLIIYGIMSYMDHRAEKERLANLPPADLNISFMGNYMLTEDAPKEEPIENALLAAFPEWQRFTSMVTYVPADEANQYAYMQKAVLILATEHPDVYIMDKNIFEWVGRQGILMNLDGDVEGGFKPLMKDGVAMKLKTDEDTEEHVYGIDLTNTDLPGDVPLYKENMIIGIRVDSQNPDKAKAFISKYLATLQ
ncbi:J domain-containing protein [Paenibacillus arenilitoris]|uniref:J domain-containing protein n=1 Tax=Paenibacillus arenilitoris TaxID=2772299 RepID=A0A927CG64_9BACL|nr:J domain-containing protein [Paenibacillus arenilitoris]MBD2867494.1 J domain-containing protein [Paenibacillus arenilitoris]